MTRRQKGEGSIFYRPDKQRWVGVVDLGWDGGHRVRRSYQGKTRAEVATRLRAALREVQDGARPESQRETVAVYLGEWLRPSVDRCVRPRCAATDSS